MSSRVRQSRHSQIHTVKRARFLATPLPNLALTDHAPPLASASPPKVSPWQINEILYSVFALLDEKTLKTAVYFVCRRWRFVATRYIIRTLRLHSNNRRLLENIQSQLLQVNALEVGPKIQQYARQLSPEKAVRSDEMLLQLIQALKQIQSEAESRDRQSSAVDRSQLQDLEEDPFRLRIQILTLNLETPRRPEQILALVIPSNLRELTIDFDADADVVHLGTILDLCLNLQRVTLSSHKVLPRSRRTVLPRRNQAPFIQNNTKLFPDLDDGCNRPHPLRSLRIINMNDIPSSIHSYFARLGNLTELYCLEVRLPRISPLRFGSSDNFWQALARFCPLLETLHIPVNVFGGWVPPVRLFPRVHDYCVDCRDGVINLILEGILENGFEDSLTALRIVKSKEGDDDQDYREERVQVPTDLMRRLLLSAPLLIHLKVGLLRMPSRVVWGNGNQKSMWACRRLKTLSLALEPDLRQYRGFKAEARHVFAYISRFCPELEELEIEANCPGLSLKSGLCLLTRLRNLQSLTVKGDFLINDPPDRRELAWIQTPSNPAAIRTSSTSKWLPLFLQGSSVMDAPSLLEEAYLQCIDMAQSLEDNTDTTGRLRMQQQQRDNQFCSEYEDQAFPMVDGLVDMEFSGSYLDIEACLQAQLFRLRRLQHLQALYSGDGPRDDASIEELKEAAKAAEVWPQMKKICLVHDCNDRVKHHRRYRRHDITLPWHLEERGSHVLHDLRPDITVVRQSSFSVVPDLDYL